MLRKRFLPVLLALFLLLPAAVVRADMPATNVQVVINNWPFFDSVYRDPATGRVLVPATSLAKAISAGYQDNGGSVVLSGPNSSVSLDAKAGAAVRQGDQALVPLRQVIEGLGGTVVWRPEDQIAAVQIRPLFASQTYTVKLPGDYFQPFALMINAGDTVNFLNSDTDVHTVVTTDDAPAKLELSLAGGTQGSYLFTKPGLYHYYCTVHAAMDPNSGMVKSVAGTDVYPTAMEGYIFVAGKGFDPPAGATVTMPGDMFTPMAVMVKAGATVTFVNKDSDLHTVVTVPGAPADVELALKGGETATYTFTKPGLYLYYCSVHATLDPKTGMITAASTSDEYPAAMQGVIAVVG